MDKRVRKFGQSDLKKLDDQLKTIKTACDRVRAISDEHGGIPTIERNLERIYASLSVLKEISEVLEVLGEEE